MLFAVEQCTFFTNTIFNPKSTYSGFVMDKCRIADPMNSSSSSTLGVFDGQSTRGLQYWRLQSKSGNSLVTSGRNGIKGSFGVDSVQCSAQFKS